MTGSSATAARLFRAELLVAILANRR